MLHFTDEVSVVSDGFNTAFRFNLPALVLISGLLVISFPEVSIALISTDSASLTTVIVVLPKILLSFLLLAVTSTLPLYSGFNTAYFNLCPAASPITPIVPSFMLTCSPIFSPLVYTALHSTSSFADATLSG